MPDKTQDAQSAARSKTVDLLETLHLLEADGLQVERTEGEGLIVRSAQLGELKGVSVEPCYPVTDFGRCLVLKDADGEEIGILEEMRELEEASMRAVQAELTEHHFVPVITRVHDISREFHVPVWEVETDRGPRRLELKRRRDVHRMRGGRIYIRDAGGNGYLIPDVRKLDRASIEMIETKT